MTNRIIGVVVAGALLAASPALAQQAVGSGTMTGHGGSGATIAPVVPAAQPAPFQRQPPTGQRPVVPPPTEQPPRMVYPPAGRQTPRGVTVTKSHDLRNGPQAFSVVLVVGEMQGTQADDTVPAAARKALTDLKDFLPYRNYRLLDSQWTLCCGRGPIHSRLRGADGQEYELQLTPSVTSAINMEEPVVNVRFLLMEAATPDSDRQADQLRKEVEAATAAPSAATTQRMLLLEQQLAAASRRGHSSRLVMDASFRMDVGETVVVGTSRIQGDKALIALLTAVPPKAGAAR